MSFYNNTQKYSKPKQDTNESFGAQAMFEAMGTSEKFYQDEDKSPVHEASVSDDVKSITVKQFKTILDSITDSSMTVKELKSKLSRLPGDNLAYGTVSRMDF